MSTLDITQAVAKTPPGKPALQRVCAGEALVLNDADTDLIALTNDAHRIYDTLLDDTVEPDDYRLAEVLLELLLYTYGIERRAGGDRVIDVESDLRRYLIPFAVEMTDSIPAERRGLAHLRLKHLQHLPRVLAGDLPAPAATVAGDRLNRRGAACIWLTLPDAASVCTGGRVALEAALAAGTVPTHTDARTGADVVMALHLRHAGLLLEPTKPHGLAKGSAGNVLRLMNRTLERARTHGADLRFALTLQPIEPLTARRVRAPRTPSGYTPVTTIRTVNALIPVIGQVVLWIGRLTGARIGEIYGLLVCDYFRDDDGRPWLTISKQGGKRSLLRDPDTGALVPQDHKDRTKSPAGVRTIPVPGILGDLLDRLIEVFHTDPATGRVELGDRLIPGVGKDDASGQSSLRSWLESAVEALGVRAFTPHDLRDALITDLKNAGVDERLAHFYAGHEQPNATIQDQHYDLGPHSELLQPVADVLAAILVGEEVADLRVPTQAREQWGTRTRTYRCAAQIEQALVAQGWRLHHGDPTALGRELSVKEVAARIDRAEPHTRRLMRTGAIVAHTRPWKTRDVWVAYERDVDTYLESNAGTTIDDLATEVGWTYHQVRHALVQLDLMPTGRARGEAVRLDADTVHRFRAEVARRDEVVKRALRVREAAEVLEIPVVSVETLIRQGFLEVTDGPTDTRDRWVTRASVEDYQREFPTDLDPEDGEEPGDVHPLTFTEARRILRLTRPELSMLTTIRQLRRARVPGSRYVYIDTRSALAYARRTGCDRAVERLEQCIGVQ